MNIVITGASKGIGFAIAQHFAEHGHNLYLTSKTPAALEQAVADLRSQFPFITIEYFAADLSRKDNVDAFSKWCLQKTQPNILINNAGNFVPGKLMDEAEGQLQHQLDTNLFSNCVIIFCYLLYS